MGCGDLGRVFGDGDTIIRQGEKGNCMYVIQEGQVEVIRTHNGKNVRLAVLRDGDFFGEISLFGGDKRTATVRAMGNVRVLTVERKIFLRRLHEDVTLAFRIFQTMATRLKEMNSELAVLKCAI